MRNYHNDPQPPKRKTVEEMDAWELILLKKGMVGSPELRAEYPDVIPWIEPKPIKWNIAT